MFGVQCVSACICIRMFVLCVYECFDFFLNLFCIQVVEMNQLDTFIEYSTLLLCHFNTLVIVAIVLFCMSEYNMTIIHIIEKIRHVHLNKIVSQIEFLFKYSIKYKSNTSMQHAARLTNKCTDYFFINYSLICFIHFCH